jgi:stage III sporulation protein AD
MPMDILRIGALGIIAAVLSVVVKQYRPELAMQISLVLGVTVFLFLSAQLSGITAVLGAMFARANIQQEYFLTILKATGVAFITEFASQTCKDAGEGSIAQKMEIGGKVLIIFLALPILTTMMQQLVQLAQ